MSMKRILAAALFALSLFATSALAQTPQVPLGPGGSGGGGGGGVTVGAAITGTCPNGDVLFSSSGAIGCEVVSGTGTVTSVGWTGGIVSIANSTTAPAFTIAGTSGGIPYFSSTSTWASSGLLSANALMIGGGAGTAPSTTTTGTGVLTALGVNVGSAGAFVVNGGALGTPSSGNGANLTGLVYTALPALSANQVLGTLTATTPSGLSVPSCSAAADAIQWTTGTGWGCNTSITAAAVPATGVSARALASSVTVNNANWSGTALSNTNLANPSTTVNGSTCTLGSTCTPPAPAAPLTIGTGGSLTGAYGYYVCTTTCSITLPTPAAGVQFCVRNDSAVTTVITIAAITSVQFEKTTFNGYGTVTTGTMVSGGALGDKICLIGRDSTHYLVGTFVGTWTNS